MNPLWLGMALMALVGGLGTALVGVRAQRMGMPRWLGWVILLAGVLLTLTGVLMLWAGG